jgi:hypothetical protein
MRKPTASYNKALSDRIAVRRVVIPAQAGIQSRHKRRMPAFSGMTRGGHKGRTLIAPRSAPAYWPACTFFT